MDHKAKFIEYKIRSYIDSHSLRLNIYQRKLIDYTLAFEYSCSMGSLDVGQHIQFLLKAIKAKRCLEIGTYTGYTTLTMALALPDDGQVLTIDVTDEYAAKEIWKESGQAHKINLVIGPAVNVLDNLIETGPPEQFDFAFIDADKENYINYYEKCVYLIKKGGIIAVDNVLWGGKVIDNEFQDRSTQKISELNRIIKDDTRVDITMLPIGDGITLCCKK